MYTCMLLAFVELSELEELMKDCVLRRTKVLIASQLPKKGAFCTYVTNLMSPTRFSRCMHAYVKQLAGGGGKVRITCYCDITHAM